MRDETDHSGEVHGRLTLLSKGEPYVSPKGAIKQRYYCSCSCGKYTKEHPKLIVYEAIKSGLVQSCGCLKIEKMANRNKARKRHNKYDLSGEYGIGYTFKGEEFYFDLEDYNKIKDYCWWTDTRGYIKTKHDGKQISLHRLILNFPDQKLHIDHIHGKETRNDNRKSNIRIVTCSQNQMNRGLQSNNTSGITGVFFNKKDNKWESRITVRKNIIQLGSFNNLEDAVNARKSAEEKYFGEYSYDNSMKMGENYAIVS